MANENDKSKVIAKIVKLFLEFLIAAVVAWFGASCTNVVKSSNVVRTMLVHYGL